MNSHPSDKPDLSLDEIREIMERERSMNEALAEYPAHKAKQKQLDMEAECDHPELDHGICLHCGKDCFDDLVDRAEFMRDCREDR